MWRPDHGGMQGNEEEVSLGNEGALTHLIDATPLLGIARLQAVEEVEVIGRRAAIVRAVPRSDEDVYEPGWHIPVAGMELAVDLERGIALRAADVALTRVSFDEDLEPALFVLEFPTGEPPPEDASGRDSSGRVALRSVFTGVVHDPGARGLYARRSADRAVHDAR